MPNLQAVKVTCRVALVPDLRMQMGALSQLVIEADLTFPYRDPFQDKQEKWMSSSDCIINLNRVLTAVFEV